MADSLIQNDMNAPAWKGGDVPYKASYGKMMMWFFLITDTLTFSAFLTPPDPFSQISLALPIILLYEISIYIAKIIQKNKSDD